MTLGTLAGLIDGLTLFGPGAACLVGVFYLMRKGFFGPHQ